MLPISRLPHLPVLSEGGVVNVRVEMVRVDYELAPIVTIARRQTGLGREGCYERCALGLGHFVCRGDFAAPGPMRASDFVRGILGVRTVPGVGIGESGIRLRGGCTPRFVIDGTLLSEPACTNEGGAGVSSRCS